MPTAVSTGFGYSLAIGSDNKLYAWGYNIYGQLGNGTYTNNNIPVAVSLPAGVSPKAITAGLGHSLAIGSDNKLYAWGYNGYGELGNGNIPNSNTPLVVSLPAGVSPTAIIAGWEHNMAIGSDNKLYAWGANNRGQLGNGTYTSSITPVVVSLPAGVSPKAIAAGGSHSLAVGSDNKLYAWGYNNYGQLGNGTYAFSNTPVVVSLPVGVSPSAIAAGGDDSLAIGSDNKLYAWGDNFYGQLINENTLTINVPVLVNAPAQSNTLLIDAGKNYTLAILTAPTLSISAVSFTNEGNSGTTSFTFTVSLAYASNSPITVNYATADGTATAGSDYTSSSGTLTFNPGVITQTITVLVSGDTTFEPNETFFVNLSAATNATIADNQALGTINDDDNAPNISVNDVTLNEGNSGTTSFNFTVSLSNASNSPITVNYATADGTATAGSDYTSSSGTLTFKPGDTTNIITVLVSGDTTYEVDETFFVILSTATNATIANYQGIGTITSVDPVPAISINDITHNEGNNGTTSFSFTFSLTNASSSYIAFDYTTADGTAVAPSDYTSTSGTLTFNPGDTTRTITVLVNGDSLYESDKEFFVNLSGAIRATIADNQGVGTITNDDNVPSLSIDDVTHNEGNSGPTSFTFTVSLSQASGQSVNVNYATTDGTAAASSDYASISGTLTLNPGVITQTVSVLVNGDSTFEPDETFSVNLSNAVNGTISDNQGLSSILNDDSVPPGISIEDVSKNEGNSGTTAFDFTVSLDNVYPLTVTVNYTTLNGSATSPSDFTATTGTLTFPPGSITQTITVLIGGDMLAEPNDSFTVKLDTPVNTTISKGEGTGTILNDDMNPAISVENVSHNEGNSGTTPFIFMVTLAKPSGLDTKLVYSTEDSTATAADKDYQPVTGGILTIPAGQTAASITIQVKGDTTFEKDESFSLVVQMDAASSGRAETVSASGTGTIFNDDAKKEVYQPPADLIGQLRQTPDRVATNDAGNEIKYIFTIKNVGQGKAGSVSLTLLVDPHLILGYTQFVNPNAWVTGVTTTEVTINLSGIEYNEVVTGTLVFRPNPTTPPTATAGNIVSSRYSLGWTNPAGDKAQSLSNAVSFSFGEAGVTGNQNVSDGQIQLMRADAPIGTKVTYHSGFWIPNETVTGWLTDADGKSTVMVNGRADSQGNFSITVDSSELEEGTYVVAAYGARSQVYGSGLLVVDSTGKVSAGQANNLKLNSLSTKTLELAPAKS